MPKFNGPEHTAWKKRLLKVAKEKGWKHNDVWITKDGSLIRLDLEQFRPGVYFVNVTKNIEGLK